jgi:RNA polymerase sigma-70 factor, ECF subfamily
VSHRDDNLMAAAARGDEEAMASLARRHRPRLERFAYRMLHDQAEAEDVAQETLIRLWRSASAYRPEGRFLAYLYTLARRRCLSHAGASEAGRAPDPGQHAAPGPDGSADGETMRCLHGLPRIHREVLVLSVCEELTYAEIAEVLGLPRGTVASRKAAALRMLRDRLAGTTEEERQHDL